MALLISFLVFCVLIISVPLGVRWYFMHATESQVATLDVISGTILVEDRISRLPIGVTSSWEVLEGSYIRSDVKSRAVLTLFDDSTITIFEGTEILIEQIHTPQFSFSDQPDTVVLRQASGRIRIIAAPANPARHFELNSPQMKATLKPGSFSSEVDNERTQIAVREGEVRVEARDGTVDLSKGERTIIETAKAPSPAMSIERDLISDGTFGQGLEHWTAYSDQGGDLGTVDGTVEVFSSGDRSAIRFYRAGGEGNHCETGIVQDINQDVSDYLSLELHCDIRLLYQSLSGGGQLSSEYPVIIRINYQYDAGGELRETHWYHGFYYQNMADFTTLNGEQIPRNIWFPYDSGNLLQLLDPEPVRITSIQIYASGWNYESQASELRLYAQ
jgi:hypothetical protein